MSEITSLQTVIKDLQTQVAALTADLAMQIAALKDASKALTERQAEVAALEEFVEVVRRTQGQALKREVERVATLEAALNKYSEDEILLTQQQRIDELEGNESYLAEELTSANIEITRLNAVLDSIWTRCYEFIANEINDQQFIQETGEYARTRGVDE